MILIFILAVVWGALAAQFFLQAMLAFCTALLHMIGILFSRVDKPINFSGVLAMSFQAIMFTALFFGGNWFSSKFIDYTEWNLNSTTSIVSFLLSIIFMLPQILGKILLTWKCVWVPCFFEASNCLQQTERVTFAKRHKQSLVDKHD